MLEAGNRRLSGLRVTALIRKSSTQVALLGRVLASRRRHALGAEQWVRTPGVLAGGFPPVSKRAEAHLGQRGLRGRLLQERYITWNYHISYFDTECLKIIIPHH